jgi:hypothetical protein
MPIMGNSLQHGIEGRPPIPSWRIVGGAFLHFAVPAYVVIVAMVTLFSASSDASASDFARLALSYSGYFLGGYAALTLVAMTAAIGVETLMGASARRRRPHDPGRSALESRRRVSRALANARSLPGADCQRLVDSLASPRWDHDDSRYQALSNDLEQVVHAMTTANRTASDASRSDIVLLAIRSLQRIDDALGKLEAERGRLDLGDARTVARYVENRHGPSDFAGS